MALSKAQLIAKQRALALEIEAAGYKESEVRQGATEATKKDTEAKEAKAYPAAVANIRFLNAVVGSSDPMATLTKLLAAGDKLQPFGKCRLDVRFDGSGGCDPVASKYSARSGPSTTATNGSSTSFKVGSWPESITFTNNTKEITAAMVIKTVARLYAVKIEDKENWPGRNIPWATHATQSKWALLITGPVVKNGVEKSKDGQTTVGARVTFTDATKPAMLLTDWMSAQVAAYKATQATT